MFERHSDRPYIQKHPLGAALHATFERNETVTRIPIGAVPICVRDDAAAAHIVGDSKRNPECFGNEGMSEPFPRESPVYRKPRQQNQGQIVRRKPANIFLRKGVARHARRGESEISDDGARSRLVGRNIGHSDRAFQLICPGMPLEVVVERFVAAVERLDIVVLFEAPDDDAHSASQSSDQSFRRRGGFFQREAGKAIQFLRRPGNLHARNGQFRSDAFKAGENEFPAVARFCLAENSTAAFSFPHSPAEQCNGIGEKI